ncbi:hypothetical protein JRQ81_012368 [Phrynocephalus forsythii]|uniref:Tenascin-X n=1 Tax=Phrynocephalus forsythii TaxID=171643 RepID=A0A9Q0X6K2_9SAUR|nr:hypothetical protein JRQ81_012368 [Phrynocephalus forsythii]
MGQPPSPISVLLLFLFWLDPSWEARVPQPVTLHHPATIPSNATVFSHVYTIKVAGDVAEGEGISSSPQEALGPPGSSRGGGLFEHTLEGTDQEHVVFTHRINLPPQTCGCPPGTEDTRDLLRRLQALENEVRALRNTCQAGGGCCPATTGTQASTGQTDIRTLCSHHGSFDLSRCQCDCEAGWGGPTCAEPACPGGCGGSQRGKCVNGRCQCHPGYSGLHCEEPPSCPDDCNDQGRCVDGRCQCFEGYAGPSCSDPTCPKDCQGHGKCVSGRCVCDPGYSGDDCGSRACPGNCNRHGKCQDGRCVCEPGFTGPACGTKACPNHCHQRGRCLKGGVCECHKGYTGPDCGQRACPEDCSGHGECQNGVCLCHDGYSGDDCATEIPSIGIRVSNRDETSFHHLCFFPSNPQKERQEGESIRLPGTETVFEQRGLKPGEEYSVTIRTEKGQRYGPPVTQTVRTLVAPPYGLQSSRVTEDSMTLQWEHPSVHPDGYVLSYVPVGAPRPVQAAKRVELPASPETVTLRDLESNTRYRLTLIARRNGENSRATNSIVVSTTAPAVPTPAKTQPIPATTLSPEVPLRDLSVTDVSPNSLRVTWLSPPEAYRSFALQYRDPKSSAPPGEIRVPGTERSVDVVGLRPRTEYELMLHGEKPSGRYDAPLTTKASTAAEIQKPTLGGISVLEITDRSARLSWDVATGTFDSFLIQYKDADGKPKSVPVSGDSREATLSDLVQSRKYKFNVYGLVGRKRFGPASTEAVTAKPDRKLTAPPSLGELSATDTTSDSVRLSWTVPSGSFDSFVIQYKDAEGRPQVLPLEGDAREVTVPSLAPSRRYRFNLYGVASRKRLGPATADVTTAAAQETAPQPVLGDLSVQEATSNSIRLAWTVPEGHFDSFLLQYQDPEGKEQTQPVNRDSREATVSSLMPSQAYRFHLYGISGNQRLGPVSVDAVTAPVPSVAPGEAESVTTPAQPKLGELSASNISSHSLQLSWTLLAGNVDSFLIQYKDASGKLQKQPVQGGGAREATVSNLVPSRRYRFNLYGVSGLQQIGPITTEAVTAPLMEKATPPVRLGKLTASNAMPNSLDLSWTVEEGSFDSFIIQYRDVHGKPQALPVDGNLRSVHLHDLAPSHRYKFNLYGILGRKRLGLIFTEGETAPLPTTPPPQPTLGELSVSDVTTPLPTTPPPQPTLGELSVSNVTSYSARLSWTVPAGDFDSFLIQYKDAEGKPLSLTMEGELREVTVPSLVPSRRYKFNLYGVSGRKRVGPVSTDMVTASLPEEPPSLGELLVSNVTSDSVHLSWTVRTGSFETFLIQYKDAQGKPHSIPVEGVFRELAVPNLVPSRRYKFNLYGLTGRNKRLGPVSTDTITDSEAMGGSWLAQHIVL